MRNKAWIVTAIIFVAIMILAVALYPELAKKYTDTDLPSEGSTASGEVVMADDFTVYDGEMNEVKLSQYFGKPIVINFWATWCGPCKSELPAFNSIYEKYKDSVVFLMINLTDNGDTVSHVNEFISDNGYSFPVYYDVKHNAAAAYGVYSIPETVFINADGTLYGMRVGAMSESVLESHIKQIIRSKE